MNRKADRWGPAGSESSEAGRRVGVSAVLGWLVGRVHAR